VSRVPAQELVSNGHFLVLVLKSLLVLFKHRGPALLIGVNGVDIGLQLRQEGKTSRIDRLDDEIDEAHLNLSNVGRLTIHKL